MYIVFFFTVPAYMLRLKHRSLTGAQIVGIETMWTAFAMYNVIRSSSFHLRLAQLQRRTERGAEVALDDVEAHRSLPDKAIDLLDEAGSMVKLEDDGSDDDLPDDFFVVTVMFSRLSLRT